MNAALSKIYHSLSNPGAYRSARDLYLAARLSGMPTTLKDVKKFLSHQKGYSIHRRVLKKFPREKTVSYGFMDLIQCDLADMKSLARKNRGFRYILLVVAVLSKRIWLKPAKNKTSATITRLMSDIVEKEMPKPPRRCQTDEGSEFIGAPWQELMKKHSIVHFSSGSKDTKASVAEVSIREVKRVIYRMITQTGSEKYVDELPKIEVGHNLRIHPRTGFRPLDVSERNSSIIFRKLFPGVLRGHVTSPWRAGSERLPFKKDDKVRVAKNFQQFRHGYLPAWNPDVYNVSAVLAHNDPPRYRLSQDGEEILGLWYAEELHRVNI